MNTGSMMGSAGKANVISIAYDHAMSKRTSLYATYGRINNGSGSNYYYFEYLWKVLLAVNYTAVMKDDPKQPDDQVTVEQLIKSMVIYGSPKTVAEKLLAFRERTGPFGGLLMAAMDGSGANRSREWESMTLLSQEVMPVIRRALGR